MFDVYTKRVRKSILSLQSKEYLLDVVTARMMCLNAILRIEEGHAIVYDKDINGKDINVETFEAVWNRGMFTFMSSTFVFFCAMMTIYIYSC